jgi:hypothetical protein
MAAGLGFKDFATGEVLTAADVDGYLMQGVWVFASAAARDAAVTSPQEGNFAYLKDTNVTTYYTGSAWANLDTTGMTNPMTTTGDTIYSSSGSTPARLGIGTAGQVLTVNSGATAPEWATPAGGSTFSGATVYSTSNTSLANNTTVKVTFNTEEYDVGGYFDSGTSTTRMTIPSGKAGYYLVTASVMISTFTKAGSFEAAVYKNNVAVMQCVNNLGAYFSDYGVLLYSAVLNCAVSDYLEIAIKQTTGNTINTNASQNSQRFQISYLGA